MQESEYGLDKVNSNKANTITLIIQRFFNNISPLYNARNTNPNMAKLNEWIIQSILCGLV